jgi:hypothetical protein
LLQLSELLIGKLASRRGVVDSILVRTECIIAGTAGIEIVRRIIHVGLIAGVLVLVWIILLAEIVVIEVIVGII